jgi:hypothetical protein
MMINFQQEGSFSFIKQFGQEMNGNPLMEAGRFDGHTMEAIGGNQQDGLYPVR